MNSTLWRPRGQAEKFCGYLRYFCGQTDAVPGRSRRHLIPLDRCNIHSFVDNFGPRGRQCLLTWAFDLQASTSDGPTFPMTKT